MITLGELYVLNRALDGKKIYGMKAFNNYIARTQKILNIGKDKETLIEKGLLEDRNNLTREGCKVIRRLELYKNSKAYIRIQDFFIGIENNNNGIIINQNGEDSYFIEYIGISNIMDDLQKKYPFILKKNDSNSKKLTSRESFQLYYLNSENGFLLEGTKDGKLICSYLILSSEGKSYIYNRLEKELEGSSIGRITEIVHSIVN